MMGEKDRFGFKMHKTSWHINLGKFDNLTRSQAVAIG